jgi:hypothetical protein
MNVDVTDFSPEAIASRASQYRDKIARDLKLLTLDDHHLLVQDAISDAVRLIMSVPNDSRTAIVCRALVGAGIASSKGWISELTDLASDFIDVKTPFFTSKLDKQITLEQAIATITSTPNLLRATSVVSGRELLISILDELESVIHACFILSSNDREIGLILKPISATYASCYNFGSGSVQEWEEIVYRAVSRHHPELATGKR